MSIRILQGDCREVLKTLPDCSVDSIVTDPPYHLTTGKKGGTGEASASLKTPHGRARVTTGFMGMTWDGGDVAQDPAMWAECLRVLKPGGYLLAFSGTRTYHRMAVAIEDAGFEIRDQLGWLYGSGFPKSHNGEWGGTALKPAWEPICMARKALVGTVEANWRQHGTGALNIDGCRVGTDDDLNGGRYSVNKQGDDGNSYGRGINERSANDYVQPAGRWPANLIHDGSDEVVAAFPDAIGAQGDVRGTEPSRTGDESTVCYGKFAGRVAQAARKDGGSAARFFWSPKASRADRNEGLQGMPMRQQDPTREPGRPGGENPRNRGAAERANHHPTVKPTDLMRYLCRLVTPPGGVVLDPFMGSGSTLKAAELEGFSAIGIELSADYIAIAQRRIGADAPLFASVEVA